MSAPTLTGSPKRDYRIGELAFANGKPRDVCSTPAMREGWDDAYQAARADEVSRRAKVVEKKAETMTRDYWTDRARSRYLDPEVTQATLDACATDHAQLTKARHMLEVCRNPRHLFGLVAEEIPSAVVELLERAIAELLPADVERARQIRVLAARHAELEAEGYAQDELWGVLDDEGAGKLGFHYGDSSYLRAAHAKIRCGWPSGWGR